MPETPPDGAARRGRRGGSTAAGSETPLGRKRRARRINRTLADAYPYAVAELDFTTPFELLVATVLSAQTTDVRVNSVTPTLFAAYPDARALAEADAVRVEEIVQPTGFFRAKTRSIMALANRLVDAYDGEVPADLDALTTLPGVGRKTANVVLGNAFGIPGLTVDTHFGRLSRRLELTAADDPVKVEEDVAELIERAEWTMFSHRLIFHGRRVCHSRKPACGACVIAGLCPSYGMGETDPAKAATLLKYELAPGREALLARVRDGATRAQLRAEGHSLSA